MPQVTLRSPIQPVATAVYNLLTSTITSATVYYVTPADPTYPYVAINQWAVTPDTTKGAFGMSVTGTLHVYDSEEQSMSGLCVVVDELLPALSSAPELTISNNWKEVMRDLEMVEQFPEQRNDGAIVQHAAIRYRWLVFSTA